MASGRGRFDWKQRAGTGDGREGEGSELCGARLLAVGREVVVEWMAQELSTVVWLDGRAVGIDT